MAIVAAVALALAFTVWRLIERKHPARALGSLLFVLLSAYVASKTGSAVNFFWPRVLVNFISAVAFVVANLIGWPLIGVVIGPIVGTRMRWRKDPAATPRWNVQYEPLAPSTLATWGTKKQRAVFEDGKRLLLENRIFRDRMDGVGIISQEMPLNYGWTGPCLRSRLRE